MVQIVTVTDVSTTCKEVVFLCESNQTSFFDDDYRRECRKVPQCQQETY